jgi:hypothetical protein
MTKLEKWNNKYGTSFQTAKEKAEQEKAKARAERKIIYKKDLKEAQTVWTALIKQSHRSLVATAVSGASGSNKLEKLNGAIETLHSLEQMANIHSL